MILDPAILGSSSYISFVIPSRIKVTTGFEHEVKPDPELKLLGAY